MIGLYKYEVSLRVFLWKLDRFQDLKIQLLKIIKELVLFSTQSVKENVLSMSPEKIQNLEMDELLDIFTMGNLFLLKIKFLKIKQNNDFIVWSCSIS